MPFAERKRKQKTAELSVQFGLENIFGQKGGQIVGRLAAQAEYCDGFDQRAAYFIFRRAHAGPGRAGKERVMGCDFIPERQNYNYTHDALYGGGPRRFPTV